MTRANYTKEEVIKQLSRSFSTKPPTKKSAPKTPPAEPEETSRVKRQSARIVKEFEEQMQKILPQLRAIHERADVLEEGPLIELFAAAQIMSEMADEIAELKKSSK